MEEKKAEYFLADIKDIVPYARNARTHSDEQIAQIAASIKEFGFLAPIIISKDNTILCGHGRFYAAQRLGLEKVPCIKEEYLSEAQKKAYIIADNKLTENGGWNNELLSVELSDLMNDGFDLSMTGFDEKELSAIFDTDSEGKDDGFDVEEELKKPCFSKTGDIWLLGKHKVICGDSTLSETYEKLMGKDKANLVLTDAPYFVNVENASGKITNDDLSDKEGYEFLLKVFNNFKAHITKDASIYEFYATMKSRVFYDAFEDAGFRVGATLIWKKPRAPFMRTDWKFNMEPIIFGWQKDGKHNWYGDQKQKAVFEFDGITNSKEEGFGHPSSKPVPLIAYLIRQSTMANGIVLDGFLGSASTLVACDQLNRICYGIEIEAKFVDVAVERFKASGATGEIKCLREGKEYSLDEIKAMMPANEASDE